jgi:hypothetical protein
MSSVIQPIYTQTVGAGGVNSITFNNIPQNFSDLKLVVSGRDARSGVTVADFFVSFNGSSESLHSFTQMTYSGGSTSSLSGTRLNALSSARYIYGATATSTTSIFGVSTMLISNYTGPFFKSIQADSVTENNGTSAYIIAIGGMWRSTAPVTSITITPTTNPFQQGSTFSLYGILRPGDIPRASGGQVNFDGTYFYHAFKTVGTNQPFIPFEDMNVEALIIGGGGGGGISGGGGGAGGLVYQSSVALTASTTYGVNVGGGGAGGAANAVAPAGFGFRGGNSSFAGFTAIGGGGGGRNDTAVPASENPGGSGGGAGRGCAITGGLGTAGQGNNGGSTFIPCNDYYGGGGGGGAGAAGGSAGSTNTVSGRAGAGGAGVNTYSTWGLMNNVGQVISKVAWFAGGGGGGNSDTVPAGGNGGGGNGGYFTGSNIPPTAGLANTGGGGGGSTDVNTSGAAGGSGLVIIRYLG